MYSFEIINLCIKHYNENINLHKIAYILNISITTIYKWISKYNYYFINNIFLTFNIFKSIKDLHIHKFNKRYQFSSKIVDYVKENNGCTLNDITKNITNNKLRAQRALRGLTGPSLSTICRIIKDNNNTRKKIYNKIVCKDINQIIDERKLFNKNILENYFDYISIDDIIIIFLT